MPCEADGECASGESCVLDHCLESQLVGCHRAGDCARGSVCVLSGYSGGPRGNDGMQSACVSPLSGADRQPTPPATPPEPDTGTTLPHDDLLKAARKAAQE